MYQLVDTAYWLFTKFCSQQRGTPFSQTLSTNTNDNSSPFSLHLCFTSKEFPIFQALLNKINQGVSVRILTNYYDLSPQPGLIDPLDFLSLAGAETRYYTTTTFLHTKYIAVDGVYAAVSSVNYSYTSFMENREAGVIIRESSLVNYLDRIWSFDWSQAKAWPTLSYNTSDMAVIHDKYRFLHPVCICIYVCVYMCVYIYVMCVVYTWVSTWY